MSNQSPSVKVHSGNGNTAVFSRSFPAADIGKSNSTAALVTSLREAQVAVNQFLTELVVQSGSQGGSCGRDEEISDDDSDDSDEEGASEANDPIFGRGVSGKRKNGSSTATSDRQDKRNKT